MKSFSLDDPNYVYRPWTAERRAAAVELAKKMALARAKERGLKWLLKTVRQQAFNAGYQEGLRFASVKLQGTLDWYLDKSAKQKIKRR